MGSLRTAASYARTGNIALAQMELDDAKSLWRKLQDRFNGEGPSPYRPDAYRAFLRNGAEQLAHADQDLVAGDDVQAAATILALRQSFYEMRRASDLAGLNDCIFALAPVMESLRAAAIRFETEPAAAESVGRAGLAYRDRLLRCDGLAAPEVASQAEFRRLIDGAASSAIEIGSAAKTNDAGLVHRYLIELQSFSNLLDFRFG